MTNDIMSQRTMNLLSVQMRCRIRFGGRGHASNSLFLNINTLTSISQDTWKLKNVIITCRVFFNPPWHFIHVKSQREKKNPLPQSPEERLLCYLLVCFVPVRDVDWRKFDLIVERGPVSAYQKGPLMVLRPIFYGFLLGFGGSLMVVLSILLITTRITQRNQHGYHPLASSSSRSQHVVPY